ncbi:hypothetical protein QM298_13940 [Pseudomonas mendocina]|nr:hypothetical protein [Pseudomonas mendocina]MDV5861979.1 hypothetical protein [Pseudomonas mendocina]
MTLKEIRERAITPALALLPARMSSPEAEVMLLAIGLQESRFQHRRQLVGSPPRPTGPAKSFWQAEQGGGMVTGLLRYHDDRVRDLAVGLCAVRGVDQSPRAVWDAIERDDVLAAGLARLLLWTDPARLPALGDADGAWQLYERTWRPGKPHRSTWPALYGQALAEVMS